MKELVKQYKKLCDEGYESKFLNSATIFVVFSIAIILVALAVIGNINFLERKVTIEFVSEFFSFAFVSAFCFLVIFPGLLNGPLTYGQKKFCKKTNIYYKMDKIFKGSLSELFDINDSSVKFVLKKFEHHIENEIYRNNGLDRHLLTSLINQISIHETEQRNIETEKEEKEALISAGTKIGRMIEELRSVKN